jgi:hypothetical protein
VVTQSSASTTYGQSTTFRATVGSAAGTPGGTVVFTLDGVAQAPVTLAGGIAELTTTTLTVGNHSVSASYAGTASLATSSGTLSGGHAVTLIPTTTALSGPGPVVYGNAASITATVSSGSGTPAGSIIFTVDGVDNAPVALASGSATLTLAAPLAGTYTVSASYAGSATHGASSGSLSGGQVVGKATTTTTVSPISTVTLGQSVNLSATVGSMAGTPNGSVVFTVDGVAQAPVTLAGGQANLLVAGLGVGSHTVSAAYSGAGNFATSTGTASAGVSKAASSLLVNSSANPSVTGQGITFTATASSAVGTPTGSLVFTVDGVDRSPVTLTGGSASLTLPSLPVGAHTVSAAYAGNGDLLASSASLPGGQTVARAATTVALQSDGASAAFGSSVTFSATVAPVAPGAGTPSGTVVFSIDGVSQAPVVLSGGVANLVRGNLGVGSHTVTALYAGDGDFSSSSGSLAGGQAVAAAATSTGLTFAPANPSFGGSATLTATVGAANGVPTGSVIFTVNGSDHAATSLINGTAQLVLPNLAVGDVVVGVRFTGSTNYLASAASDATISVAVAATTTTVTSSTGSVRLGEPVTLSAAVASLHGTPTGSVEFRADGALLGTVSLAGGAASLTTSALTLGNHAITASYLGSSDHGASSGALAVPVAVTAGTTSLALTASPQPAHFGDAVTLTATATAIAGTATGSVIFSVDGVDQPVATLAGGVGSLVVPGLEAGVHTIAAGYFGVYGLPAGVGKPACGCRHRQGHGHAGARCHAGQPGVR